MPADLMATVRIEENESESVIADLFSEINANHRGNSHPRPKLHALSELNEAAIVNKD